jgi:hypothetical protein
VIVKTNQIALFEYDGEEIHLISQDVVKVVMKQHIETISDHAFGDCEILKELKLCDGLRQIGNSSFKGCASLEKKEIKSNLELIGSSVFEGYSGATKLIIPKGNLKSIGNGAFTSCVKIDRWRLQTT